MRVWTRVDKSRKSRERRDCSMSSLSQNIILFFGMFLAGKCTYIPTKGIVSLDWHENMNSSCFPQTFEFLNLDTVKKRLSK